MISVPADIAGQSKHAADWLDGRKEQGPSPVLARAKRQMEELEVDWADAYAMPETEPVTVPRQRKQCTEELATSHLPPAISASHTAKPQHPSGKVFAHKTAEQQLMAAAAERVQRQAEHNRKKEDDAKKKRKKEEEEKRKKKKKEEEEKRKKKEKEEEEKRRKKAEEEKAEKVMLQRALSMSLLVLCILSRVLCPVLRMLCICTSLSRQARLAPS